MFRAVLKDVDLLRNCVSIIGELIDEGIFKIDKEGISLTAADRAMVAVVDFKMHASAFEEFEVDKEHSIGLDISNFLSALKRASSEDKAIFTLQDSKIEILLQNSSKRRFALPLLELSPEEIPAIDQLQFTTKAKISSEVLETGIEDASTVSDAVVFGASPSKFSMKAEGDVSSTELEIEKGEEALIELKANKETTARYPLDYLEKMVKAAKIADVVELEWGQDYPIKISFEVPDKISLTFILAPRVSESE
ncbi:MAG: proliferating cell nuclear antigen (pcna) [Candidatus Aenigmatarchaeota archaeon]